MNKKTYISPEVVAISNIASEPMMAASIPPADTNLSDEEIDDINAIESKQQNYFFLDWED